MVCQQPTTDICSFFTRAFVLCTGEVVYFGETGSQAMQLLASSGMPCPPLYSPLEQFMRLIDPSFEASPTCPVLVMLCLYVGSLAGPAGRLAGLLLLTIVLVHLARPDPWSVPWSSQPTGQHRGMQAGTESP